MHKFHVPVWFLAMAVVSVSVLPGCDQAVDLALSGALDDADEYVRPPLPPITSEPISLRAGIDFPQDDMGETFAVAFIDWDIDSLAEVLVEEHRGKSQAEHATVRAAFEAGGETYDWGTNFLHAEHALLLQFRDHPYTIWLFAGPHTDTIKELSKEAEVWVYAYDYDFSGTEWIETYADGKRAGSFGMGGMGGIDGDFAGRVTEAQIAAVRRAADMEEQGWDVWERDEAKGDRLMEESQQLWKDTISDVFASRDVYLPMFYGDAEDGSDWLVPRTARGNGDVRAVRLVKF
ncbi:MAG: hypothetical protein AAF916_02110 [Planctomycetota bacterium]